MELKDMNLQDVEARLAEIERKKQKIRILMEM